MSVLFETRLGDIVVDLETELCPILSMNFLKLCKTYKYNFCSFFNVQRDFIAQTGDPTDQGTGGTSIFGLLPPSDPTKRYFTPELPNPLPSRLKHASTGTLSMAVTPSSTGQPVCASQFFFTLADNLDYLDGKHAVFGRVVEGGEALQQINDTLVDNDGRPLRDIRIRHVVVLEDPFDDPPGLDVPPQSPIPTATQLKSLAVGDEEELPNPLEDVDEAALAAADEERRDREARSQALTLEMIGDLPFHAVRPPENILFVCKLHQVTKSEDLELIFSRFGTILSCEVIRDQKTGDSLQYAFIEFDQKEDAERAYAKMDGVLVDDRRIHVDFSQSVSKLHANWLNKQTTGPKARPSRQGHQPGSGAGRGSKENGYGMVFDMGERDRRERDRDRDRDRDRRGGDRRGGDGRERRDRDDRPFKRERERTRSRSPPRHRDRDRERDRDRRR